MDDAPVRTLLVIDDDEAIRSTLRKLLGDRYRVESAADGAEALLRLDAGEVQPDLILLDVRMPGLDGYQVCERIQEREEWSWIPVVFVTVLTSEKDRKRALEAGGAGWISKPFEAQEIHGLVEEHLSRRDRWGELRATSEAGEVPEEAPAGQDPGTAPSEGEAEADEPVGKAAAVPFGPDRFQAFKDHLRDLRTLSEEQEAILERMPATELYELAEPLDLTEERMGQELAGFLELPFLTQIRVPDQALGALPRPFCRTHRVVPLQDGTLVLANPFDAPLIYALERGYWRGGEHRLALSAPGRIRGVLGESRTRDEPQAFKDKPLVFDRVAEDAPHTEGARRANEILRAAVAEGASDVHLHPREGRSEVRFRVEGQMETVQTLSPEESAQVVSRLKALAGMDLAERRRPQDGSVRAHLADRRFKLRLATSSTIHGESVVVRILEPEAEQTPLEGLGMTEDQAEAVREMVSRPQGALLLVGPTGAGKSTTIYSAFAHIDSERRSVMSVEDPVEYTLESAQQQEVNERAALTFESLLHSSVRQDPDVLFLGEIRDDYSAQALLDFASSGHLTISSLHAANATAAIFRLERLGVERGSMAEALSMIVSQKLLRTLCPHCREVSPPDPEERRLLRPFVSSLPDRVARPVGCARCRNSGYLGREAVFEVLSFDAEVREMVREGRPAREIRDFFRERGDLLLAQHALAKVRELRFAVRDVHQSVLLEEREGEGRPGADEAAEGSPDAPSGERAILLVDPSGEARARLADHLRSHGYRVEEAEGGVEALWALARTPTSAVVARATLSELDAPTLLRLLERKGIDLPVVFVTDEDDEEREAALLAQGAADVVSGDAGPELVLARLERTLGTAGTSEEV